MKFTGPNEPVIIGFARTPFGMLGGCLAGYSAMQLASMAIKGALEKSQVDPSLVTDVIIGNALTGGLGQNPGKLTTKLAGIPSSATCTLVNKVCGSGMKAVLLGCQSVFLEPEKIVVVGGTESMSQTPFYAFGRGRTLPKYGDMTTEDPIELKDGICGDGLTDISTQKLMGEIAEQCAKEHSITRQEQDDFCISSYTKGIAARDSGRFREEIISIPSKTLDGTEGPIIDSDEELTRFNPNKIPQLRPSFCAGGTITPANASGISDGAAFLVITSHQRACELRLTPLCLISACSEIGTDPKDFTLAPATAIGRVLSMRGAKVSDIDFWEINEAFSLVGLVNQRMVGIPLSKLNVDGGAVALGHPLGASGSRIICVLARLLGIEKRGKSGIATVCNGGGGACAVMLETVDSSGPSPSSAPAQETDTIM